MRMENLSVDFNDKIIFRNATFDFPDVNPSLKKENQITCLVGPSGAGKTTLLRVIAGLVPLKTGTIIGNGKKPAIMFQEDRLLPWLTAKENIQIAIPTMDENSKNEASDRALWWLKAVELEEEANTYPNELSGGMLRRVALARALAYGGDIILLDEPVKGLDQELIIRLAPLLKEQTSPIILSSHSQFEIDLFGGKTVEVSNEVGEAL